jgi:hypothetical protein
MSATPKTLDEQAIDFERARRKARRMVDSEERGRVDLPEILTLRERLTRERVKTVWRIDQLQAVGQRVLLAAAHKAGKTTLAANVARSVLDGDLFLDTFHTTAIDGALVLFDFEMSPNQLDDWYQDQQINRDDQLIVIPMRGAASSFNIVESEVCAYWVELLKSKNVKYLILDCLRPVLDALGLNEHTEAGYFLTALDTLLRNAEIPEALVIQHMGHQGERARGDSRLLDWPDVGWKLTRDKPAKDEPDDPSAPRSFSAYGRDVEVPETVLTFDKQNRRLRMGEGGVGVSRADVKKSAVLMAVVQVVEANPGVNQNKLVAAVQEMGHHKKQDVLSAVDEGVKRGFLIQEPGPNRSKTWRVVIEPMEPGLLDGLLAVGGKQVI